MEPGLELSRWLLTAVTWLDGYLQQSLCWIVIYSSHLAG